MLQHNLGRLRSLFFIAAFVSSLACQAVYQSIPLEASSKHSLTHQIQRASPTPIRHTLTPAPPPIRTLTSTSSPTLASHQSSAQFMIFEKLWQTVNEFYLYPDFNGLDWDAAYDEYSQRIRAGLTDPEFYSAMEGLISSLNDDHSIFLDPEAARDEDFQSTGNSNYVGLGILTNVVPDRNRIVIILTFPDSPAEQVGLLPHDSILEVNGQPIMDENGFRKDLLRGPLGSKVVLTVQSPGQESRRVLLRRDQVSGFTPILYKLLFSPRGERIGYILIPTFTDETIDNQVGEAIQTLSSDANLDGLILDNRQNPGGSDIVVEGVLSYFTSGLLGYFIDRDQNKRPLVITKTDLYSSNEIPLVVLVGRNTVSFAEIFSGILQDAGRAYIIGEPTEGNIELLWGFDFSDGSRAWIAHENFRPINHPEQDWEATGILPDLIVFSNWDEVTTDTDPVIQAAVNYFDDQ